VRINGPICNVVNIESFWNAKVISAIRHRFVAIDSTHAMPVTIICEIFATPSQKNFIRKVSILNSTARAKSHHNRVYMRIFWQVLAQAPINLSVSVN